MHDPEIARSADAALTAWRGVLRVTRVEPIAHADSACLVTGEDGRRYVLKRIDGLDDLGERRHRLAAEFRILLHLRSCDLPVALPLATDNARLYSNVGDAIYTLTPMLESDGGALALQAFREIGRTIGRLHQALAAYRYDIPSWHIDLVPRTFDEALSDVRAGLSAQDLSEVERVLDLRRHDMITTMTDLPVQRIHGDCHLGNILVCRGKVSGLIDLDHLPSGPRTYDLAYLLANRAADEVDGLPAAAAHLMRGYLERNTLEQQERAAMVPVMLAVELQLVGWILGHPRFVSNTETHLSAYHWIASHYDELVSALAAVG